MAFPTSYGTEACDASRLNTFAKLKPALSIATRNSEVSETAPNRKLCFGERLLSHQYKNLVRQLSHSLLFLCIVWTRVIRGRRYRCTRLVPSPCPLLALIRHPRGQVPSVGETFAAHYVADKLLLCVSLFFRDLRGQVVLWHRHTSSK